MAKVVNCIVSFVVVLWFVMRCPAFEIDLGEGECFDTASQVYGHDRFSEVQ